MGEGTGNADGKKETDSIYSTEVEFTKFTNALDIWDVEREKSNF